jgi:hypothetical protein
MAAAHLSRIRIAHGLLALLALIGLVLEYKTSLSRGPGQPLIQTLRYLSFFTIISNAAVALASLGRALGDGPLNRWAVTPGTRGAISVYIIVVAAIFQLLLSHLYRFTGSAWWGNLLAHQLVPALWITLWVGSGPHGRLDRAAPFRWLILPLAYSGWTLVVGGLTGWFPYPFVDYVKYGAGQTAISMTAIALFFLALGFAIRWIDGRLARRT